MRAVVVVSRVGVVNGLVRNEVSCEILICGSACEANQRLPSATCRDVLEEATLDYTRCFLFSHTVGHPRE